MFQGFPGFPGPVRTLFAVINLFCIMIKGIPGKWSLISQTKLKVIPKSSPSRVETHLTVTNEVCDFLEYYMMFI